MLVNFRRFSYRNSWDHAFLERLVFFPTIPAQTSDHSMKYALNSRGIFLPRFRHVEYPRVSKPSAVNFWSTVYFLRAFLWHRKTMREIITIPLCTAGIREIYHTSKFIPPMHFSMMPYDNSWKMYHWKFTGII